MSSGPEREINRLRDEGIQAGRQEAGRLLPLAQSKRFWVITNEFLRGEIMRQLPRLDRRQITAEPAGRNTAPAIGLAAFILARLAKVEINDNWVNKPTHSLQSIFRAWMPQTFIMPGGMFAVVLNLAGRAQR